MTSLDVGESLAVVGAAAAAGTALYYLIKSRRNLPAQGVAPAVVRTLARLFVRSPSWPPAHAPADAVHFSKLRSEGGVKQIWPILKHDGDKCKPAGGVELATVTCHTCLCSNLRGSVLLLLSCPAATLAPHRSLASHVRLQMCSTTSPTGRTKRTSTTATWAIRSTLGRGR